MLAIIISGDTWGGCKMTQTVLKGCRLDSTFKVRCARLNDVTSAFLHVLVDY